MCLTAWDNEVFTGNANVYDREKSTNRAVKWIAPLALPRQFVYPIIKAILGAPQPAPRIRGPGTWPTNRRKPGQERNKPKTEKSPDQRHTDDVVLGLSVAPLPRITLVLVPRDYGREY